MNRALVHSINGALIALCCWLAADIVIAIAARATEADGAVSLHPLAAASPQGGSWEQRQAILTRNLFKASTAAPAIQVVPEAERYAKTRLALRLLATVSSSDPAASLAAVENQKAREHEVVRIGDTILGARVAGIDRRRIVLDNRGRREELALDEEASRTPRPLARRVPTRPPRAGGASVQRVGRNRFAVDRSAADALADNPAALFSQARIIPRYEAGQMTGIQLSAIKPGSVFEQAGLQDGDTVIELNGISAGDPAGSQQLLQEFRNADRWTLKVRDRNGAERTIDFVKN